MTYQIFNAFVKDVTESKVDYHTKKYLTYGVGLQPFKKNENRMVKNLTTLNFMIKSAQEREDGRKGTTYPIMTLEEQKELSQIFDVKKACSMCNLSPATHANNSLCLKCWADCEGQE